MRLRQEIAAGMEQYAEGGWMKHFRTTVQPSGVINLAMALKIAGYLFITLQAMVVWQGSKMLENQEVLVRQGVEANEKIAVMATQLSNADSRFSSTINELKKADERFLDGLNELDKSTRVLEQKISKLEAQRQ